jgi:outer membrane protein OmpA-like peptidoglycan-associated protein
MNRTILLTVISAALFAQVPSPTQANEPQYLGDTPVFRVTATARSIRAINYQHREGSTQVNFAGTGLMPRARGEAKVDSKTGATKIDATFSRLEPAQTHGDSFLTYVMWAITPEGRPENLGEVMLSGDTARLQAATDLQAFGLIVTAEPYYSVTQPSDTVVMEGEVKPGPDGTTGTIAPIEAKYELLEHGSYDAVLPAADRAIVKQKNDVPLDLKEARHAMAIARGVGALTHAADTMQKASIDLQNAEAFWTSRKDTKRVQTLARNVTQLAEDARIITLKKREEERLAGERRVAEANVAAAKSDAEREASQRAMAELERRQALESEREAKEETAREAKRREYAETQQAALTQARADAEILIAELRTRQAKTEGELKDTRAQADAARAAAAETEAARLREREAGEHERAQLRIQIREQLNRILQTQDTARGLIVNMSDVLFDTAQYSLRPGAREKLAKVSGILLAHPELKVQVEGHTDSVGPDEYNQTLSENRANAVRTFLTSQGVDPNTITAKGFGKTRPVTTNDTAAGRQQNRRVELVVSGDSISASN